MNDQNTMDKACMKQSYKENTNYKETAAINIQEVIAASLGAHNEERSLREFNNQKVHGSMRKWQITYLINLSKQIAK